MCIRDRFEKVYSGHYHTRSDNGKVYYLGNPYEMYWNDVGDIRGFHIFDTDTMEHTPIDNHYNIFHNLYYEDDDAQLLDTRQFAGKILKLIVRKKSDPKKFERYIDKIYASDVHELKKLEKREFYAIDGTTRENGKRGERDETTESGNPKT